MWCVGIIARLWLIAVPVFFTTVSFFFTHPITFHSFIPSHLSLFHIILTLSSFTSLPDPLTKECISISYCVHLLVGKCNIWGIYFPSAATQRDRLLFYSQTVACECRIKKPSLCCHLALWAKSWFSSSTQCVYSTFSLGRTQFLLLSFSTALPPPLPFFSLTTKDKFM